jgi:hypothetical protein
MGKVGWSTIAEISVAAVREKSDAHSGRRETATRRISMANRAAVAAPAAECPTARSAWSSARNGTNDFTPSPAKTSRALANT